MGWPADSARKLPADQGLCHGPLTSQGLMMSAGVAPDGCTKACGGLRGSPFRSGSDVVPSSGPSRRPRWGALSRRGRACHADRTLGPGASDASTGSPYDLQQGHEPKRAAPALWGGPGAAAPRGGPSLFLYLSLQSFEFGVDRAP